MTSESPRFEHDCDTCAFLGRDAEYDLYFHHGGDAPVLTTVIARYGSDGDYLSGIVSTMPALVEARRRAIESHLYEQEAPPPCQTGSDGASRPEGGQP